MILNLYIRTDSDAFQPDPAPELARLLRAVADRIEAEGAPSMYLSIHDAGGVSVGRYALKPGDFSTPGTFDPLYTTTRRR